MSVNKKIIDIKFKDDETQFIEMQEVYNSIGKEAIYMSHYDLADKCSYAYSPIEWKLFLQDPRVAAFLSEELEMLKNAKLAAMLNTADTNRNTGQAQLLNTLLNQTKKDERKSGPVFIYSMIPLNEEERHARNVMIDESNTNTN